MTNQPKTVALYARVSTKDKGQHTENQLAQLREFARKQGWRIVKEYVDHRSGKNGDRPQFRAMFNAACCRDFDVLLFWSLDRFSREGTLATLQYLQRLDVYGIAYRSYTENWLDSLGPFKDVVLSLLATLAKQERVRLSERVHAGLARAKRQGRVGGRPKAIVKRDALLQARENGASYSELAEQFGISKMTAQRICTSA